MASASSACIAALLFSLAAAARAQGIDEGRALYQGRCLSCHGDGGAGGELGPNIVGRLADLDDVQVGDVIRNGKLASGMPAFAIGNAEMDGLAGLTELAHNANMLYYMTDEAREGKEAFLEKRPSRYSDSSAFPRLP